MKVLTTVLSVILTPLVAVMPLQADMVSIPGSPTSPAVPSNALQIRLADAGSVVVEASSSINGYAIVITDGAGLPVVEAAVAIRLPEDGATGFFQDGARSAVAYTDAAGVAKFAKLNWGPTVGTVSIRVTATKGDLHAGALIEQRIVNQTASDVPQVQLPTIAVTAPAVAAVPLPTPPLPQVSRPAPGTPASVASVYSGATPAQAPARATDTTTAASDQPSVSIVTTAGNRGHGVSKKWILLAVVAAGAVAGIAMAMGSKGGSSSAASTTGLGIGAPTLSVGH